MRRAGNLIHKIIQMDNLCLAYYKARKSKQQNVEVIDYGKNLNSNIKHLQKQIETGDIEVGNYEYFNISDPKRRQICAASFPERVLHHAIMNICHPVFERNLIYDTYATRKNKGIYAAIGKAKKATKKYKYVAKLDMRKYFDSISHIILKQKLRIIFKDYQLIGIFDNIIDSYRVSKNKGIPIGNLTSQYFANFYLSAADHFAKEQLKIPVYLRYMDDILMFKNNRAILKEKVNTFKNYIETNLELQLKPVLINSCEKSVLFLGYTLYPNKILLNGRSKKRFKKKIVKYHQKLENSQWTEAEYQKHILPLLSFVKHAYTKKLRKLIFKS